MRKLFIYVLISLLVLCLPVNADDLVIFKTPNKGVVNAAGVNLRSGPGLDEQIVGIIHKEDTPVDILGHQGDWFKVKAEEGEAWIYGDYVTMEPADPISASGEKTDKTAATGEEADSLTEASDITAKPEEAAALPEDADVYPLPEEAAAPPEDADVYPLPEEVAASAESTDIPASTDEQKHIDTSRDKEEDHEEAFKVNDKAEAEEGDSSGVLIKDILFSGNTVITTEKLQKLS
ncbi:MAG: SH3 domain-containing protein, partial [Thermodesulfobacteriota bacterium]|nr:SH3 domain-containing protein [Thermodesulfobacteriota bacterium]